MTNINFIFTCEGTSDSHLVEHIKKLLILRGAKEVHGEYADLAALPEKTGLAVSDKLAAIQKYYANIDAIFVHRDADNAGIDNRESEIREQSADCHIITVPVIPIKNLEAWLLSDRDKIIETMGSLPPNLPRPSKIEACSTCKEILKNHSESLANKRQRSKAFYKIRLRLCTDLDPAGPVSGLSSHKRLVGHIDKLIQSRAEQKCQ
ncbi:hypothetical protein [Salinicola salarius]|jgi:hypothetical protein|uniref:hypothetical protein n=1 Tax=Salinicola salarius TaxID=430457 RepID=UPI0026EFEB45|nr:hypothetical protein [Salinicola salarius]